MLVASKTWPLTKPNLQHLQHKDRAMRIGQICNIQQDDVATVRSRELLAKLDLEDIDLILRKEGLAGIDMWRALAVQSGLHVIHRLIICGPVGPRLQGRH